MAQVDFRKLASTGTDFSWMTRRGRDVSDLIGQTDFIDFKALGYKGDPIIYGGRFKQLPLGTTPAVPTDTSGIRPLPIIRFVSRRNIDGASLIQTIGIHPSVRELTSGHPD